MTDAMKADLRRYLQLGRDAVLWKLDGLSEYDMRRPMTSTGTNLLGIVKHLTAVELGYFGWTFDRPFAGSVPWASESAELNSDMWATAEESSEYVVDLYRQIWTHSDATIDELALDAEGAVPHWPADRAGVTLHRIIVHVIADMDRHAGHADIVREMIDGVVGLRAIGDNLPSDDELYWSGYVDTLEAEARKFRVLPQK
ncbi:DinB family protein [Rhodococcus sp. G-MC3]|uniref:DinB family protein n=1 Tax=Rhodococcus sp. G-MC3 TaxID=3046209 RepID=UPI0024B87F8A|nr:DinB family protein [Rhodococcus sp. G-MC3]MDJ0392859.1 DinB family protein [Rhodococcus sp. G-MC3]